MTPPLEGLAAEALCKTCGRRPSERCEVVWPTDRRKNGEVDRCDDPLHDLADRAAALQAECEALRAEVASVRETMLRHDKDSDFWHGEYGVAVAERDAARLALAPFARFAEIITPDTDGVFLGGAPEEDGEIDTRITGAHFRAARAALARAERAKEGGERG